MPICGGKRVFRAYKYKGDLHALALGLEPITLGAGSNPARPTLCAG